MNKFINIFLLMMFLGIPGINASNTTVKYPSYDKSDVPYMFIDSICLSQMKTIVYCTYNNVNGIGSWVSVAKEMKMEIPQISKSYPITDCIGVPFSPDKFIFKSSRNKLHISLVFPPLPTCSKINIIENEKGSGFNFYGVDLTKNGEIVNDETKKKAANDYYIQGIKEYNSKLYREAASSFQYSLEIDKQFYDENDIHMQYTKHWIANSKKQAGNVLTKSDSLYCRTEPVIRDNNKIEQDISLIIDSINYYKAISLNVKLAFSFYNTLEYKINEHPYPYLYNDVLKETCFSLLVFFYTNSAYGFAETIYKKLLTINNISNEELANIHFYGSSIFLGLGDELKSTSCLKEMERSLSISENHEFKIICYHNLFLKSIHLKKDFNEAYNYVSKENQELGKMATEDLVRKVDIYTDYAIYYSSRDSSGYDQALFYIDKACNIGEANRSNVNVATVYIVALMRKAIILTYMHKIDQQIETSEKALYIYEELCKKTNQLNYNSDTYRFLLSSLCSNYKKKDISKAVEYYIKSWKVQKEIIKANLYSIPNEKKEAYLKKELYSVTNPLDFGMEIINNRELASVAYDFFLFFNNCMTYFVRNEKSNFSNINEIFDIHWQDIAKKLRCGDIAIEFTNFGKDDNYAALVIDRYSEYPKLYYLGKYSEFHTIFLNLLNSDSQGGVSDDDYKLGEKIWGQIIADAPITDNGNIFFHSTGFLNQWPIEDCFLKNTGRLSAVYNVYRLSSTKEITRLNSTLDLYNEGSDISNVSIFGGLNYDLAETSTKSNDLIDANESVLRGKLLKSTRSGFDYLKYSSIEADTIANILRGNNITLNLFKDNHGTEEAFRSKTVAMSKILHLATHSCYLQKDSESKFNKMDFVNFNDNIEDQLSRAILILSGGNRLLKLKSGLSSINDGILTGKDIEKMDLSNIDMVILSSCESGVGTYTYDGVAGLQMAFKRAGVRTIVMSQYEIDDRQTLEFMIKFYNNLRLGYSKHKAFKLANETCGLVYSYFTMLDAF